MTPKFSMSLDFHNKARISECTQVHSISKPINKPLLKIKSNKMKIETEQQRKELLQDVIDRLLYLPNGEQEKFVRLLELSLNKFQIAYNVQKGDCRIYQKINLGKQ